MPYPWMHYGVGTMLWWPILWVLLLAIFTMFTVWVVARLGGSHRSTGIARARQILDERLARGDIDPEEYRARLASLLGA